LCTGNPSVLIVSPAEQGISSDPLGMFAGSYKCSIYIFYTRTYVTRNYAAAENLRRRIQSIKAVRPCARRQLAEVCSRPQLHTITADCTLLKFLAGLDLDPLHVLSN
jgi:hypothetical protein